MIRVWKSVLACTVVAQLLVVSAFQARPAFAFTKRDLVYGSTGYDVDELQNRLGFLGYYHHSVDGQFGWSTYWAVRDFQYAFGMKPTGTVDMATKLKLVKVTSNWHYSGRLPGGNAAASQGGNGSSSGSGAHAVNSGGSEGATGGNSGNSGNSGSTDAGGSNTGSASAGNSAGSAMVAADSPPVSGINASDQNLLAHVVYAEARGEPFQGQVAVAAVILNRLKVPAKFPHTIPGIIYQPAAFTSVQDGQINLQPNAEAFKAVRDALSGMDPSDGATYYFNPATATSPWIWSKPQILQIGHHIFCRT